MDEAIYWIGCFVGEDCSVCGQIVKEAETESEPEALARWLDELDGSIAAIGLEAGPLSQWLHRGLTEAGLMRCSWKRAR